MADKKVTENNENEFKFKVSFPNENKVSDFDDERSLRYKDELMKLIIDTRDEEIELKIKGSHYQQIGIKGEWRGDGEDAYFSYQEKAAKDFIYHFNRCGILSDQVGMGKTIEAGMIISELAYRRELGSLLILVPNENMAEKWETELARKFGFRNYYKNLEYYAGKEKQVVDVSDLPKVGSIKSLDSLYSIIYSAVDEINNSEENRLDYKIKQAAKKFYKSIIVKDKIQILQKIEKVRSEYKTRKELKMHMLKDVVSEKIKEMVEAISNDLGFEKEYKKANYEVDQSGNYYFIVDMYLDTEFFNDTPWDRLFDESVIVNSIVDEFDFIRAERGKAYIEDMRKKSSNVTINRDELVKSNKALATNIRKKYAILIVSKIITVGDNPLFNLLNYSLNENYESESIKYCSTSIIYEKSYRVIDFLIDMLYKTLIVDEAHDYIRVSHKLHMEERATREKDPEKRQREGLEFGIPLTDEINAKYVVFPLYDDYYFVEKDCMYLKVKTLAERSFRKIFMTATPIKSDMIDFYLLYLLADNSGTSSYNRIRELLTKGLITEEQIRDVAGLILNNLSQNKIKELNYYTHEDIAIKYIYNLYKKSSKRDDEQFEDIIRRIVKDITKNDKRKVDEDCINDVCINSARVSFQGTFTINNKGVDSISELVSTDEGIEAWQSMYSQIGIRSTRHQTYKLDDNLLSNIIEGQRQRYKNLPMWAKRNGTVIYIRRKDLYFDMIVNKMLDEKRNSIMEDNESEELEKEMIYNPKNKELEELSTKYEQEIIQLEQKIDNPSEIEDARKIKEEEFENAKNDLDKKYRPKEKALNIFNYINEKLTGDLQFAYYDGEAVNYVEFKLHMIATMMTCGLISLSTDQQKSNERIFIKGQVLLFVDEKNKDKVYDWLCNQVEEKEMNKAELDSYNDKWKHYPVWYYNKNKSIEDRWFVTNDIKALSEKTGNYIIVVEPNKYEEGVDLQKSNTLINFDIKLCPLKMEQRIGRIDRVKLVEEQPQLQIYSFAPLNDMSGFMVNFLANELKMFSCWKGDTTGIVSMPLGTKENSATFESAINQINEAYKGLYDFDADSFISGCKKVIDFGANFTNNYFDEINNLYQQGDEIRDDFRYLKMVTPYINEINFNSFENGAIIPFGEIQTVGQKMAIENGEQTQEQYSNHRNDPEKLKNAIESYYNEYINYLQNQISEIKAASKKKERGSIESANYGNIVQNRYERLTSRLEGIQEEFNVYKDSEVAKLRKNSLQIKQEFVVKITSKILGRYEERIRKYLDVLISLFDKFCKDVKQRSDNMAKFISYLTIEEFKAMVNSNE